MGVDFLKVDTSTKETVINSFNNIADALFYNYHLRVNDSCYRLIDMEFYYYDKINVGENFHKDIHTHRSKEQLHSGKWYFHKSGIDITFGNGTDYGGILIRGIAKLNKNANSNNHNIEENFHGPIIVTQEICSNFYGAFENNCNALKLDKVPSMKSNVDSKKDLIVKTKRIGLTSKSDDADDYYLNSELRYQILINGYNFKLDYKNKEAIVKLLLTTKKIDREWAKELLTYNVKVNDSR